MIRFRALAAIPLVLLIGCGGANETGLSAPGDAAPASGSAQTNGPSQPDSPTTAERLDLDLTAPAVEGADIDLSTYAGKDLALWFWAPW